MVVVKLYRLLSRAARDFLQIFNVYVGGMIFQRYVIIPITDASISHLKKLVVFKG
jgi:hypothetical protein